VGFSEAAPKGIPHGCFRCLAPTGSSLAKPTLVCTDFLQRVVEDEISYSVPPHFAEVNKIFAFFSSFCLKNPFRFCMLVHNQQKLVHIAKTPVKTGVFETYFLWARKKAQMHRLSSPIFFTNSIPTMIAMLEPTEPMQMPMAVSSWVDWVDISILPEYSKKHQQKPV
jgi:hypothetical protein